MKFMAALAAVAMWYAVVSAGAPAQETAEAGELNAAGAADPYSSQYAPLPDTGYVMSELLHNVSSAGETWDFGSAVRARYIAEAGLTPGLSILLHEPSRGGRLSRGGAPWLTFGELDFSAMTKNVSTTWAANRTRLTSGCEEWTLRVMPAGGIVDADHRTLRLAIRVCLPGAPPRTAFPTAAPTVPTRDPWWVRETAYQVVVGDLPVDVAPLLMASFLAHSGGTQADYAALQSSPSGGGRLLHVGAYGTWETNDSVFYFGKNGSGPSKALLYMRGAQTPEDDAALGAACGASSRAGDSFSVLLVSGDVAALVVPLVELTVRLCVRKTARPSPAPTRAPVTPPPSDSAAPTRSPTRFRLPALPAAGAEAAGRAPTTQEIMLYAGIGVAALLMLLVAAWGACKCWRSRARSPSLRTADAEATATAAPSRKRSALVAAKVFIAPDAAATARGKTPAAALPQSRRCSPAAPKELPDLDALAGVPGPPPGPWPEPLGPPLASPRVWVAPPVPQRPLPQLPEDLDIDQYVDEDDDSQDESDEDDSDEDDGFREDFKLYKV